MAGARFRIAYVTPSGSIADALRAWSRGSNIECEVADTYSGRMFDYCRQNGAQLLALSFFKHEDQFRCENLLARSLRSLRRGRGLRYHLTGWIQSAILIRLILRFRPHVLVVSDRSIFWPALALLRLAGVQVILSMHVRVWTETKTPRSAFQSIILGIEKLFFRRSFDAVLAVSRTVAEQVRTIADGEIPTRVFRPTWNRQSFDPVAAPVHSRPFRLLYSGRVEWDKGVFDLFQAVEQLIREGCDIQLDVCGNGTAVQKLRDVVAEQSLEDRVRVHGHLDRDQLMGFYAKSHAVVVPTRSEFGEGYNKVTIEAVLSKRPVVTSQICPAINDVPGAAIEVTPDAIDEYKDAIFRLYSDEALYRQLVDGALEAREQIFAHSPHWGAQAEALIKKPAAALR